MATSRMRISLVGVVVIIALAAGGSLSGFTPQDPVAAAVDRYARGDYDAAIAVLTTSLTVAEFLTGLRWINLLVLVFDDD